MAEITVEKQTNTRSIGLLVAVVLTGLMFHRAMAFMMLSKLGQTISLPWAGPMHGDVFIGFTAPIIAFLLWKYRGLAIWTIGIVWHATGIKDYIGGMEAQAISTLASVPGNFVFIFFPVMISVHLLCIYLLVRYKNYYLR